MIIYVPEDIYARLNVQLKGIPEKMTDVLRKTINNTAQFARKDTVKRAEERYLLQEAPSRIKAASDYESARGKQLQATITVRGSKEPLINFDVVKNGVTESAKARVLKTSSIEDLTVTKDGETLKAFVQTVKNHSKNGGTSTHIGVFQRLSKSERKDGGKRNAIKQLYSIDIPQMIDNANVYPLIENDIQEKMRINLEKHIAKVMEGMT